jgi:hypothetical protein
MKTPLKFVLIVLGEQKLVVPHSKIRIYTMNVQNIVTTVYLEKLYHSFFDDPQESGKGKIRRNNTTTLPERQGNCINKNLTHDTPEQGK